MLSRKGTSPLRLSNEKQGTSFFVSLLSLDVLLKVAADHWCLGTCAQPWGTCHLSWSKEKPPVEAKINRDIKPSSRAEFDLVFRLGLTMAKMVMTWILTVGGEFRMCINPPNQEIKVKQSLSGVIILKHLTVQNWSQYGRLEKSLWSSILLCAWFDINAWTWKLTSRGFQKCKNINLKPQCSLRNQMHKTWHFLAN